MLDEFQGREIPVGQPKEGDLAPRALRDGSHQLLGFQLPKSTQNRDKSRAAACATHP